MCFVYCGKIQINMGSVLGPVAGQTFEVELFQSEEAKTFSMSCPGKTGNAFELTTQILMEK